MSVYATLDNLLIREIYRCFQSGDIPLNTKLASKMYCPSNATVHIKKGLSSYNC